MTHILQRHEFEGPPSVRPGSPPAGSMKPGEHCAPVLTDQQGVQDQPGAQIEITATKLAAALGWSRSTLGRRVTDGLIARRPGKGRKSIFSLPSIVDATASVNTEATSPLDAIVGVSAEATTRVDATEPMPVDATIPPGAATVAPGPAIGTVPVSLDRAAAVGKDATTAATFLAALALAAVSGSFSVVGLTSIFAGAFWPIIGMGVGFEGGKLAAVAWLGCHGRDASRPLACALVVLVTAMVGLNAIGAYGFLSQAHAAPDPTYRPRVRTAATHHADVSAPEPIRTNPVAPTGKSRGAR
jgi:hypothetical protein